jgi:hypothetical protein
MESFRQRRSSANFARKLAARRSIEQGKQTMRTLPILLATPLLIYSFSVSGFRSRVVQSKAASKPKAEILSEDDSHAITTYAGWLEAGPTYRATVRGNRRFGLSLVPAVRMHAHQALLVEWTNLGKFPALKRLRGSSRKRQIVFTVVSDETQRMTEWRWNRTVGCKILFVE